MTSATKTKEKGKVSKKSKSKKTRKRAAHIPYGLEPGTLKIPKFEDLDLETKRKALELFAAATQMEYTDAFAFAVEYEDELLLLRDSPAKLRGDGVTLVYKELYRISQREYMKQQAFRTRKIIKELTGEEPDEYGDWTMRGGLMMIGSAACSVQAARSTTRPYLMLVAALVFLRYQDILLRGAYPGKTDREVDQMAYTELGYFPPHKEQKIAA